MEFSLYILSIGMVGIIVSFDINGLKVEYGNYFTLDIDSLFIDTAKITCIIGRNGCGKSTLIKAMCGLIKYPEGNIIYNGREIKHMKAKRLAREIAVLSQKHNDVSAFKVKELISLGRFPYNRFFHKSERDDRKAIEEAVYLTRIENFLERKVNSLSGGELQRVWIALALVQQPDVLFLDEPSTFMDIVCQIELLELIKKLNTEKNIGIVAVMHDLSHVLWLSDDVIMMSNGKVVTSGPVDSVMNSENIRDVFNFDCRIENTMKGVFPSIIINENQKRDILE